ncbi:hypothetical protein AN639_12620 [Candidatus Epulonipiscium fishelsonii]|uniref:Uncharacterized protein n=1 Tax=Candidatus Epulonipiscium fishelsonii TaxID=77094 RepID=A0ACC8XH62_9FIRM|nr:hypothetical protein AN639_12620 [Epulopiscium sp. SCG-B05WGA-EpuloA1]ONI42691.1 hypothetical protein AN396_13440 [Epulopiscium sp. SCG-B11WGA-EpuloA1]ONI47792.1 hypothetical protein AN644_03880 [Epulopiscium sp. SCG-C06WGA-EpuloA1]
MYEKVIEFEKMYEEVDNLKEKLDNAETGINIMTALKILETIDEFTKCGKYQNLPMESEKNNSVHKSQVQHSFDNNKLSNLKAELTSFSPKPSKYEYKNTNLSTREFTA